MAEDGDVINSDIPSILNTYFAGKEICECCFEKIENEILHRMQDILPWYKRILDVKRKTLEISEIAVEIVEQTQKKDKIKQPVQKITKDFLKYIKSKHIYLRTVSTNGEIGTYNDEEERKLIKEFMTEIFENDKKNKGENGD